MPASRRHRRAGLRRYSRLTGAPMLYSILKAAHVLAIVLWVGGMLFAHAFLRPALAGLDPPQRLSLMHAVLARFFAAVTGAIVVVLSSGLAMFAMAGARPPWDWTAMTLVGLVMMAIFAVIRLRLFPPLRVAVQARDWPAGAAALARIRQAVATNLALGLAVIALTVAF